MNNTNLVRFEKESIELYIDTVTGESFASQGMLSKICEVEAVQIKRLIEKRGDINSVKVLPVKDSRGVTQETKLYNEDSIYECLAEYKPQLLKVCAKAGIRIFLHGLAGYKVKSTAVTTPQENDKLFAKQFIDSILFLF